MTTPKVLKLYINLTKNFRGKRFLLPLPASKK